jgi:hypothetical protein
MSYQQLHSICIALGIEIEGSFSIGLLHYWKTCEYAHYIDPDSDSAPAAFILLPTDISHVHAIHQVPYQLPDLWYYPQQVRGL